MIEDGAQVEVLIQGEWKPGMVLDHVSRVYRVLVDGFVVKRMIGKLDVTWRTLS